MSKADIAKEPNPVVLQKIAKNKLVVVRVDIYVNTIGQIPQLNNKNSKK